MLLDFFQKLIWLLKLPFLADLSLIFPNKVYFERSLLSTFLRLSLIFFFPFSLNGFTQDEKVEIFSKLDWKDEGKHSVPEFYAVFTIPKGYRLVLGQEAVKAAKILGLPIDSENLKALVFDDLYQCIVHFSFFNSLHVSLNDWNKVDSHKILESYCYYIEENQDIERPVLSWVEKPLLNLSLNTIVYAIQQGENYFSSLSYMLGRKSFALVTCDTSKRLYPASKKHFDTILTFLEFEEGYRYEDYEKKDDIPCLGIADLLNNRH